MFQFIIFLVFKLILMVLACGSSYVPTNYSCPLVTLFKWDPISVKSRQIVATFGFNARYTVQITDWKERDLSYFSRKGLITTLLHSVLRIDHQLDGNQTPRACQLYLRSIGTQTMSSSLYCILDACRMCVVSDIDCPSFVVSAKISEHYVLIDHWLNQRNDHCFHIHFGDS